MMLTTEPKVRYTKSIFLFLHAGDRPKDLDYAIKPSTTEPHPQYHECIFFFTYHFKLQMDLAEHKLTVTEDHLYLRKLSLDKM